MDIAYELLSENLDIITEGPHTSLRDFLSRRHPYECGCETVVENVGFEENPKYESWKICDCDWYITPKHKELLLELATEFEEPYKTELIQYLTNIPIE